MDPINVIVQTNPIKIINHADPARMKEESHKEAFNILTVTYQQGDHWDPHQNPH